MQNRSRRMMAVVVVVVLVASGITYYVLQAASTRGDFVLSGTIEASEVRLSSHSGGDIKDVYVDEGNSVTEGQPLIRLYSASANHNETIRSPINGVVVERLVEQDELAAAGRVLIVVADLNSLSVKVYVPESRYGKISVGQTLPLTVDSYPGETFTGTVSYISDSAEFTPRNVQTVDSRQTTVYAVKLNVTQVGDKLKMGMPADVHFQDNGQ